ncbi:MAG: Flp pilus assembly protein CpaB [Anaerolineaceae bacterium]|nr:Flp pilus assembly protein CpaB [Anaerolineaceae bacterium]
MNSRTRLFLLLALIIIVVAVIAALLLQNTGNGATNDSTPASTSAAQQPTRETTTRSTPEPTAEPIEVVEVVIAVQDIPRGLPIAENMVAVVQIPEQFSPFSAFSEAEDVIGKIARTDIAREEIIIQGKVVDDLVALANSGNVGSDAAAMLPSNRVLVAVPMDRLTSVAYAIQPGDRVDVMVSLLFIDVDDQFQSASPNEFSFMLANPEGEEGTFIFSDPIDGRFDTRIVPNLGTVPVMVRPSEQQRPRLTTQRTIQNALVVNVGDFPADGRLFIAPTPTPLPQAEDEETEAASSRRTNDGTPVPPTEVPRPDIIALAVSPQDAVVLTWYVEAGVPITFALRSASSTSLAETDPVTLDYILNRFRITLPDRLPYSIEPAIRSIRQLEVGTRIQLNTVTSEPETNP